MTYTKQLLDLFKYDHLPARLQGVSKPYADLAHEIVRLCPHNEQRTRALEKLVESKDCAVRTFVIGDTRA